MTTCFKCQTECEDHHYITRDDVILCPECFEKKYGKPEKKEVKDAK